MDTHGFPWISIDQPWISTDIHGYMDIHGWPNLEFAKSGIPFPTPASQNSQLANFFDDRSHGPSDVGMVERIDVGSMEEDEVAEVLKNTTFAS